MTKTIPDLWPDDIRVDVRTPLAILKTQASLLSSKTRGLLIAELLTTTTSTKQWIQYQLDIVAVPLKHYRVSILTARHRIDEVYPVTVHSRAFGHEPEYEEAGNREATTEEEFITLLRFVLRSGLVRSLIQSLIVRVNEVQPNHFPHEDGTPCSDEEI